MKTLPIGMLFVAAIVSFVIMDSNKVELFFNFHSFLIVVLGTVAIFLFSTPSKGISLTIQSVVSLFKPTQNIEEINKVLKDVSKNKNAQAASNETVLIKYAKELWTSGVDSSSFDELLDEKFSQILNQYDYSITVLRNIAKYPPTLGMAGTVMGMISLFTQLNPNERGSIGLSLATAMTATFYGLVLANMILLPFVDRLQAQKESLLMRDEITLKVLKGINKDEPIEDVESIGEVDHYYENAG